MAKRRKVANMLALAVLGTVVSKPMHPYEIASVLRVRGKDKDMPIKWGSLYRVVQNLERHGLLRAGPSERQGARPERTVYEITDAGRAELVDWVRELIADPDSGTVGFKAGLSLLGVVPPDEVERLLGQRVDALGEWLTATRAQLTEHAREVPYLFLVETGYELTVRAAELDWARDLLRQLATGAMPGLAQWREFHRTGEIPDELIELVERGTDPT